MKETSSKRTHDKSFRSFGKSYDTECSIGGTVRYTPENCEKIFFLTYWLFVNWTQEVSKR